MANDFQETYSNYGANNEIKQIQDSLFYDFRNFRLNVLANKIKSQLVYKPKPKIYYH